MAVHCGTLEACLSKIVLPTMMLRQQSELLGEREIQGITPNKAPIGLFRIIASHVQGQYFICKLHYISRISLKSISPSAWAMVWFLR
jgi:hypothetical protein